MKKLILIIVIVLFPCLIFSQYFSKTLDLNNRDDHAFTIVQADNGFIIEVNAICSEGQSCEGLIKVDNEGEILWKIEIDSIDNLGRNLILRNDKAHIAGSFQNENNLFDIRILSYSMEGELINNFIYEGQWENAKLYGFYPLQEGYMLAVTVITSASPLENHPLVIYLDEEYNVIWERELIDIEEPALAVNSIKQNASGDILIAGKNRSFINNSMLYKFNTEGEEIWKYKHSIDNRGCGGKISILNSSTEYLLLTCPNAWSQTEWPNWAYPLSLVKLTENGEMEWENILWAIGPRSFGGLLVKENDDIIVSGVGDLLEEFQSGEERQEGWLVSYNSDMEKQWERFIIDKRAPYFISRGLIGKGLELENGDLIFTGRIHDTIPGEEGVQESVWLLRTDHEGCLEPDCGIIQIIDEDGNYSTITATEDILNNPNNPISVKVFPNPAKDIAYLQLFGEHPDVEKIKLIDALGRVVKEYSSFGLFDAPIELVLPDNLRGIYYIRAYTAVGNWVKPLVVE